MDLKQQSQASLSGEHTHSPSSPSSFRSPPNAPPARFRSMKRQTGRHSVVRRLHDRLPVSNNLRASPEHEAGCTLSSSSTYMATWPHGHGDHTVCVCCNVTWEGRATPAIERGVSRR